ncbi:MAG TPA: MMPL family transporter [Frankiaceae bacterium]
MLTRLSDVAVRHRRLVGLFWLLIFVAGAATAGTTQSRLKVDFSLPHQPGYEAGKALLAAYGTGADRGALTVVRVVPPGGQTVTATRTQLGAAFDAVRREVTVPGPGGQRPVRVVDYAQTGDPAFVARDDRSAYALVFGPPQVSFAANLPDAGIQRVMATALPGAQVGITGLTQLETGSSADNNNSGVLVETLVGALGALLILAFVFASFLALVPLLIAAVSILSTLLIVLALTTFTDISFIVLFLVSLVGLGVAIDYSLLLVTRWREERAHGRENVDAVRVAMQTAGHAVIFSAVTVAIGLFALVVLPVPFLRSVGFGGMLIPLVSMVVTLTLVPALLAGIGPKVDVPRIRKEGVASRFWTRWTRGVVRSRWVAAVVALGLLVTLLVPFSGIKIGVPGTSALAQSGPAHDALAALRADGAPAGIVTPIEVLVRGDAAQVQAAAAAARSVPGVTAAVATLPQGLPGTPPGGVVIALPQHETVDIGSVGVVDRVRAATRGLPGVVGTTGIGAAQSDFSHAVYGNMPLVLTIIVVLSYLLLVRAFRSLLLPLKAVLLNLLSVSATFGLLVLFWQDGHGSNALFGVPATGAITFFVPLMTFAFLFGLSMDYEVFILARVREEYDAGADTDAAVIEGVGRTGRLVTSAALILFLSFASLASGPEVTIKIFATGLGAGILLDATVVRMLLVPSLVSLFGRWNWWLPAGVARVLRVEPSPLRPAAPPKAREPEPVG